MQTPARIGNLATRLLPGLFLCIAVTVAAVIAQDVEARLAGAAWLEALVLAIIIGTVVRTVWNPGPRYSPGINFSAKFLLEVAVMLLGASVSAQAVMAIGPRLLGGIAIVVMLAITGSYTIGRFLRLPRRMAMLIACGNSICGNSAIAAVAPVIDAEPGDVAASIAFTAVLGVAVVILLPLLIHPLALTLEQYGVLAGLTVYAVPQVLAATIPVGPLANQVGTIVKLVRVLMLGPVVLTLSILGRRGRAGTDGAGAPRKLRFGEMVPWFIIGFLVLATLRSTGLLPHVLLVPAALAAGFLTTLSMAGLGLGVDARSVAAAGPRVTTAVVLSLLCLGIMALILIHATGVI